MIRVLAISVSCQEEACGPILCLGTLALLSRGQHLSRMMYAITRHGKGAALCTYSLKLIKPPVLHAGLQCPYLRLRRCL